MDHAKYLRQKNLIRQREAKVKRISMNAANRACGSMDEIAHALLVAEGFDLTENGEIWQDGVRVGLYDGMGCDLDGHYAKIDFDRPVLPEGVDEPEEKVCKKRKPSPPVVDIDPDATAWLYETKPPVQPVVKKAETAKSMTPMIRYFDTEGFRLDMKTGELILKNNTEPKDAAKEFFDEIKEMMSNANKHLAKVEEEK